MIDQFITVFGSFLGVILGLMPYVICITKNITLLTEKEKENEKEHLKLWEAIGEVKCK